MIQKIISGAQTGADRAGIDAAIESGVDYGGWLPHGRKAEDGIVPAKYTKLQEIIGGNYPERTKQNVIDCELCVRCGMCAGVCPIRVIEFTKKQEQQIGTY